MEREKALEIIKGQLPEKRYIHTLGVLETAEMLAEKYGADMKKVELAAIFHDYAKYRPIEEMKSIVREQNMGDKLLKYGKELLHAPVGAYLVKKEVGINDEDILDGIRFHTTGRPNMTLLEKIIYIADYIEPNRSFSGVDEVRLLAANNLNEALTTSISNTIQFLIKKKQPVFPDTLAAYNHLILKEEF
ncbi:bis(5'-nucleosyl)-tetraphosphatase (symmetrical) YqeK [Anaerobacillus sp. CMMVII]|uniref:bis(5'-nucleosyl)-tetraphosphatase (symmetrical) YqeK n=1 Tax=Anaerobacillus sp. CMMVII TaxID=2755588 RepID=UPI0021B7D5DC|nr:bis(5'-nucleosyl)-tetraphosphatase (symmetrical) YqeK [Anaerobacillus sp. CMMVII]MCT8139648.1 bis(5'-nucleosyl)-tetraphosphatase (symmetrical) YqeK [Anaerobacillus sp. CMMVII]